MNREGREGRKGKHMKRGFIEGCVIVSAIRVLAAESEMNRQTAKRVEDTWRASAREICFLSSNEVCFSLRPLRLGGKCSLLLCVVG